MNKKGIFYIVIEFMIKNIYDTALIRMKYLTLFKFSLETSFVSELGSTYAFSSTWTLLTNFDKMT